MVQRIAGILILAFLGSATWAGAVDPYEAFSVVRVEKRSAPDFSLPEVGGKALTLSAYRGKIVLLGFFQTF